MTTTLDISNLRKQFGAVIALASISFSAQAGERIALLGHNGAGKTTLFRLILGFLAPSGGDVSILGASPGSVEARRAISYLPESVAFPKNLTGAEVMSLYARLKRTDMRAAKEALERVGLDTSSMRRIGGYSKGMRQRLGLAIASLGSPKLILLDEPTSGLDPQSRSEFYGCFQRLSEGGATIVFSSHTLNDVNGNADRILILKSGALVGDGDEAALRADARLPGTMRLFVDDDAKQATAERLGGHVNGSGAVVVSFRQDEKMAMIKRALDAGAPLRDIEIRDPSLADIYRAYSQGEVMH